MPRRKRSENRAATAPVAVREQRVEPATTEVISGLCPCCGRGIPEKRTLKVAGIAVGWTPYFDSIDWRADKPFAVAMEATGRGSFQNWRPISPEEAPELFESVRQRLLDAVSEYLAKGWLTAAQVEAVLTPRQTKSK